MKRRPSESRKPETTGLWESRLLPLFQRYSLSLTLAFLTIASVRIVSTYAELSLTVDEPGHIACGLEYLSDHIYRQETQHPPLTRAAVALGPYLAGLRIDFGHGDHFVMGLRDSKGRTALATAANPNLMIGLARLGTLPFFWLTGLVIYAWAKRYFDRGVAVLAAGLFSLLPPVLAHSGLATTDMGLCAGLTASFFALLVWTESPTRRSGIVLGVCAALAILSKFTALAFLPSTAVMALLCYAAIRRPGTAELRAAVKSHLPSFALAVATGAVTVWMVYWFSFGVVPSWRIKLPAPEFFDGVLVATLHNSVGHPTMFLGEKSQKGWWYYFPAVLSIKTPLAFLLLLVPGGLVIAGRRTTLRYLLPFGYSLGILLPAMAGSVNIGVRHILPIYAGLSIVAALGLVSLFRRPPGAVTAIAVLLVLWMAGSGALSHPDYLSYFNELSPEARERVTMDSDLDWGQDMRLAARILRTAGATEVATNLTEKWAMPRLNGLPPFKPVDRLTPSEGWNLIGPTLAGYEPDEIDIPLAGTDYESLKNAPPPRSVWWKTYTPTKRVGGLLLFYMPPRPPNR
jgi:hypothetical protein